MPTIPAIATQDDWPTDRIVSVLNERGTEVFRMDTAEFPQELILDVEIGDGHEWRGALIGKFLGLALDEISAAYYRTTRLPDAEAIADELQGAPA
ncbi:hypothetical protein P8605_04830 [Streptomyces sp. T-3]|nr:hypothetical protein [Streptomyces sp. T-3]